ncbi:MAG: YbbR-like domain-containing protein [Oligoflexus sp.]
MLAKLLNIVVKNFWYKLLSLLLAIVIWGIIQGEQVYEVSREVQINVVVPEGYAIRGDDIRSKSATIRGPRVWMLEAPEPLVAEVVIPQGIKSGSVYKARIDKDKIKDWNERLQLIVHDPYLEIFVDRQIERTVPIKEVLQGTPAEGYIIEKVNIDPLVVVLTGVRSDVLKVRQIVTEPIDISGLQESKHVEARLIPPPGMYVGDMSIDRAQIHLKVGDSKINKRFGNIPIEIVGGDYEATVRPSQVSIMVQGTPGVLNFVTRSDFRAFVETRGLAPGRYEQDVRLKIPPDTVLIETFPEKAILSITDKKLLAD